MRKRNVLRQLLLMFSVLGSLVLPACAGIDPAAPTARSPTEEVLTQPAATIAGTTRTPLETTASPGPAVQAGSPAGSAAETATVLPAPTAAEIRTELKATDPSGVVLASGQLQLVEFFAFW